jgi:hypothetical protein
MFGYEEVSLKHIRITSGSDKEIPPLFVGSTEKKGPVESFSIKFFGLNG